MQQSQGFYNGAPQLLPLDAFLMTRVKMLRSIFEQQIYGVDFYIRRQVSTLPSWT